MKLIVGLGNPGSKYRGTRHNAGFDILDVLAQRWNLSSPTKKQLGSLVADGAIALEKCILALPQGFMNRSGQPVASIMGYYKLSSNDVIVVHDDMAIDFGHIRCKKSGGHGGHNGLRDIIKHIGNDFLRIRFGVGRPPEDWDSADFVLSKWTTDEKKALPFSYDKGVDAIEAILRDGVDSAMNDFNVREKPPISPIPNL